MDKRKQSKLIRTLISLLKDKLSLLRRATSPIHVNVLLATSHTPSSPPPYHRIAAILSLPGTHPASSSTVSALTDRLTRTSSAHVALKCLIALHHIIAQGSFIIRDELLCNFPNLSGFRDNSDYSTWELSNWVRFYSRYLETNVIASREIGFFISSANSSSKKRDIRIGFVNFSNWELMQGIETLVGLIEEICRAPSSGFDHKSSLIHEILKLITEDYGSVQRIVERQLGELTDRVTELSRTESDELACLLRRVEGCRERVSEVFGNKKRNDAFWEFVKGTLNELTQIRGRVGEAVQVLRLSYGSEWVGLGQGHVTIEPAMA